MSSPVPAPLKRRVGVLGTLVCDSIVGPPPERTASEGWGGIAYALSGLGAALDEGWEIVPLLKVGVDVIAEARSWVAAVPQMAPSARLVCVDEANNRSELQYYSADERTERMSGGVPSWSFDELRERIDAAQLDALYVNFLSGSEVDLATMGQVREHFSGPIYVDLHMLLWVADSTGRRTLRMLADLPSWCACFDVIQVNDDEMRTLAGTPEAFASLAMRAGALATFVTMGPRGVRYDLSPSLQHRLPVDRPELQSLRAQANAQGSQSLLAGVQPPYALDAGTRVDPTGCGDVWGGTVFARLLAGDEPTTAMATANRAASHNAESQGVDFLADRLRALRQTGSDQRRTAALRGVA